MPVKNVPAGKLIISTAPATKGIAVVVDAAVTASADDVPVPRNTVTAPTLTNR